MIHDKVYDATQFIDEHPYVMFSFLLALALCRAPLSGVSSLKTKGKQGYYPPFCHFYSIGGKLQF